MFKNKNKQTKKTRHNCGQLVEVLRKTAVFCMGGSFSLKIYYKIKRYNMLLGEIRLELKSINKTEFDVQTDIFIH